MLLSIGMIVKNEEKHLRNCLEGIKPILEQVESELIICDTGSTDGTIEIAKEFTSKIIEIEWKNDFAYARQHTLDPACGEWYMFIDADEIMQNPTELIEFFNSGEYKEYGFATLARHERLVGIEEHNFPITLVPKLFKRNSELRWTGIIHEHMLNVTGKCKGLAVSLMHYGYYHETEEAKQAKLARNIVPLLKWHEEEPSDARVILQLAGEYRVAEDYEKALHYTKKGLKLFKPDASDVLYHSLVQQLIMNLNSANKPDELITESGNYFNSVSMLYANAYYIRYLEGAALQLSDNHEEAITAFLQSLELFEKKESMNNAIFSQVPIMNMSRDDISRSLSFSYLLIGEFDKYLSIKDPSNSPMEKLIAYNIYAQSESSKNPSAIAKIYIHATANFEPGTSEYESAVTIIERGITTPEIKAELAAAMVKCRDMGDGYVNLHRLRHTGSREDLNYFLNYSGYQNFHQRFGDVIYYAIKHNADFTGFAEKLQITNTGDFTRNFVATNENIGNTLLTYLKTQSISTIKGFRLMCSILYLMYSMEESQKLEYFEGYVRMNYKLSAYLYREDVFCESAVHGLSEHDCFTFYAGNAYNCKDRGDGAGYVKNLSRALHALPSMQSTISALLEKFVGPADSDVPELTEQSAIQKLMKRQLEGGGME